MELSKSDVKKFLNEIESASPDKLKEILRSFLIASSENKDIVVDLLENRAVEILAALANSSSGKLFGEQIAGILFFMGFDKNRNHSISDVILSALSNIISKSDLNVFMQCLTGIRNIASPSSPTLSPTPTVSPCFLSPSSATLLLEKTAALLSSAEVSEWAKKDILDMLLEVVNAGLLNEAADFAMWVQSQVRIETHGSGGGSGGSIAGGVGNNSDQLLVPGVRFLKAFESFAEDIKKIANEAKKRSGLWYVADGVYKSIQEKAFFPSLVPLMIKAGESEAESVNLPLKFITNSNSNISNSGSKILWSTSCWSTFAIDPEISKSIYKIVMFIENVNSDSSALCVGVTLKSLLSNLITKHLYGHASGTCCISHRYIYCGNSGAVNSEFIKAPGKATVGLELNADKHTLHFFVDDKQLPHFVTGVPASVFFAVSLFYQGSSAELKSFVKLGNPSVSSSTTCTQHNWK